MNEVQRYYVGKYGLVEGEALGRLGVVLGADFDRVTAERDALQALLTAADERADHWRSVASESTCRAAEPVAVFEIDATGYRCRVTSDPSKDLPPNGTKLYAQQPSPVSVVMRCSFCDVVNEHGSPWSEHSESVDGNLVYRVIGCKDHAHLVDACLDTFTRLNKKQD